jgi:hypothetical protein
MKRREAEKEMDERDDAEMRRRKAETDQLFLLYQQEKDKKRSQDAQALSELHLKQAVSFHKRLNPYHSKILSSKIEKNVNVV